MRQQQGSRLREDERGAAAVEFGLIAILLFTLLFGIIQFSIWFWAWQAGAQAAREAARYAAVMPKCTTLIQDKGANSLSGVPVAGTPSVTVTAPATVAVGEDITVRVQFSTLDLHFFPGFTGEIDKSATSRIENVPVDC
jgi:Flp pilus assembly protein TadG